MRTTLALDDELLERAAADAQLWTRDRRLQATAIVTGIPVWSSQGG